jgi:hypothetical protein
MIGPEELSFTAIAVRISTGENNRIAVSENK